MAWPAVGVELAGPNSVAKVESFTQNTKLFWLAITLAQPNLFSNTFTKLRASQERRKVPVLSSNDKLPTVKNN